MNHSSTAAGVLLAVAVVMSAPAASAQTTLFADNFEDGVADGWTVFQGSWSVVTDGGTRVYRQAGLSSKYRSAAGSSGWTDYAVQARVKPTQWNGSDRFAALAARFRDGRNTYLLALRSSNRVELIRVLAGSNTTLASRSFPVALNTSYILRLEVSGSTLRGFVNGALQLTGSDGNFPSGRVGGATDYASAHFDDFVVTSGGVVTNQPPQVNAGPDQTITLPSTARLAGQVNDDGLPNPPGGVTCTWSRSSGPGTVTFSPNANTLGATAAFSAAGGYQLTLTCSDSQLSGSDSLNVMVNPPGANQPPQVSAGPDQTVTQPSAAFLNGSVSDDGLPNPPGAVTCTWSRTSGPGTVTFSPGPGALSVSATFSALGTYTLALTCSDSQLTGSDSVTVIVRERPAGDPGLVGFAAVNALGQDGTTGGAGGDTVFVNDAAEFLEAIARPGRLTIRVQGMISLPGPMHDVTSDKSILGEGSSSGITGGGLNIGLPIDDGITSPPANAVRNVIIRNLVITNCPDDCINVQMFTHHVWIDHNDLSDQADGALDVKRGSDFVTISWNRFHNSDKNMLLGHDDSNGPQDIGRLRVSYHHNFFDGSIQRNPRVRFGEPVHVFNNYFLNITGYGVASQMNAGVMVENNYFDNVEKPTRNDVGGDPGRIVARGNINVNTEDPIVENPPVAEPRNFYPYTLDPAASIPDLVRNGAGVGRITP